MGMSAYGMYADVDPIERSIGVEKGMKVDGYFKGVVVGGVMRFDSPPSCRLVLVGGGCACPPARRPSPSTSIPFFRPRHLTFSLRFWFSLFLCPL